MKSLSLWAKAHVRTTRTIFAIGYFVLTSSGLLAGIWLSEMGVQLSEKTAWPLALAVLLSMHFFPRKGGRKDEKWKVWRRQRVFHAMIFTGAVALFAVQGNRLPRWANTAQPSSPLGIAHSSLGNAGAQTRTGNHSSLLKKTAQRTKTFVRKTLAKRLFKLPERSWGRFFKFLGLFLLISGGVLVLSALACSLACSGNEGGAAVVLVVAGVAAGFAFFMLVRSFLSVPPGRVPDIAKPS